MSVALWIIGSSLLLVTALPFLPSGERFVRIWDFPRTQIAFLLAVVLAASIAVFGVIGAQPLAWHGLLTLALCYQVYRILPYTSFHGIEAKAARGGAAEGDAAALRVLVANVRQSNRQSTMLTREIVTTDPDLVLLTEIDVWWAEQIAPLRERYPHVVEQPQDDSYGIYLMSRLPLIEPKVRFLLEHYVPSIKTGVRLTSGAAIDFYGVHPKPPPLQDTEKRDAELLIVAQQVRAGSRPAIVAGDLNDVAWSDTTRLFQKVSGLLDPRVGRGLYNTYHAGWPVMRWPVDHVFFAKSFLLLDMRRLGDIGSDHFPFYIALSLRPEAVALQTSPEPEAEDLRRARDLIREGKEEASEG